MPYSIELRFDRPLCERMLELRRGVMGLGIAPGLLDGLGEPHLSLAVYDDEGAVEPEALVRIVDRLAAQEWTVAIAFPSIGLFPTEEKVLFLAPVVAPELLQLHRQYHALAANLGISCRPYYLPGRWVPHCTLATLLPTAEMLDAIEHLWRNWQPLLGTLRTLAVIRAQPVELLHERRLEGAR
jgi:2'-5' RNA ligase